MEHLTVWLPVPFRPAQDKRWPPVPRVLVRWLRVAVKTHVGSACSWAGTEAVPLAGLRAAWEAQCCEHFCRCTRPSLSPQRPLGGPTPGTQTQGFWLLLWPPRLPTHRDTDN